MTQHKIDNDAELELDKIIVVMNKYPLIEVELGVHTDAKGSDIFNKNLSEKRAQASAAYIKKNITNPERISGKGYGETKLLNRCRNGVNCGEKEHAKNRRTEFKVINTSNDNVKSAK